MTNAYSETRYKGVSHLSFYYPTPLESWISDWYIENNILEPEDISIEIISELNTILCEEKSMNSHFLENKSFKMIIIDSRVSLENQREQFFHELCHILRHAGKQTMMPKSFLELQEWNAKHFTRYATIPYHMLKFIDYTSPDAVTVTSSMFKVTPQLVIERFSEIKRRVLLKNMRGDLLKCVAQYT